MKYKIKNTLFVILTYFFFTSMLLGCSRSKLKTIIIKENSTKQNVSPLTQQNNTFKINKIYKYNPYNIKNNQITNVNLLGWFDNENVAGNTNIISYNNNNSHTINSIDYKYHFTDKVITLNNKVYNESLSPDGKKLAYFDDHKKAINISTIDSNKNKNTPLIELNIESKYFSDFEWSNNSKYISFLAYSNDSNNYIGYIYDTQNNILKKITLTGCNYNSFPSIVISDDGTRAIIITNKNSSDIYYMYLFTIDKNLFNISNNKKIATLASNQIEFINSNKVFFINMQNNSLNLYDVNSNKITKLVENVKYFKLSNDLKNIVYMNFSQREGTDIYACKINKDSISNNQLLYKGFSLSNIYWSPDNKKILLGGYSSTINTELDKSNYNSYKYLIIEFD